MSLKVWLPLNGNLKNQGIDGITLNGNPASYSDGKIGKAATWNGSLSNVVYNNTTAYNYTDNFSYALWVYPIYTGSNGQFAFTVGRADAGGFGYGLQIISSTQAYVRFGNKVITITCNSNTWTHIAMTVANSTINVYVNGVLATSQAIGSLPTYSDGNGLGLGCFHYSGDLYPYYGKINDFRIYDHALSPKEVKEISKALVVHYPLDGNGKGNDNLFQNSFINTTSSNYGFGTTTVNVTQGKTYTISAKGYISEAAANSGTHLSIFCYKPDWSYTPVHLGFYSTSPEVKYATFIASQTTTLQIASYSFKTQGQAGDPVTTIWYKAEEGSEHTPWCPNSSDTLYTTLGYNSTTEYDTSGFGNNGTKTKAMNVSSNTAKYSSSTIFDGSDDCILTPFNVAIGSSPTAFTINTWIYKTSIGTKNWQTIFGGPSGFELEARKSGESNPVVVIYNWGQGQSAYEFNKWNMVTMVWTTSDVKLYINGELKVTGNTASIPSGNYYVGSWRDTISQNYEGQMSDFRIYATALSADDIKELYQTSISLADNGTILGYEFNEE